MSRKAKRISCTVLVLIRLAIRFCVVDAAVIHM